MILLNLERKSHVSLFMQMVTQLKALMDSETLKAGFRMPSSHALADKHGVHRSTVVKAYEELWALGYMESRPGSYSVVRKRRKPATAKGKSDKGVIPWEKKSCEPGKSLHRSFKRLKFKPDPVSGPTINPVSGPTINLASLDLDSRLFPVEKFRKCMNTVLTEQGADILRYGACEGYAPLREIIARRLRIHGISVNADEILITNGSQNGIELVLKLLTIPGTPVAVESPTYSNVLPLLNYHKTEIIEIPMRKYGMDLDHLQRVLEERLPAFIYSMPNFHNPTGITTDQAHREQLLALCEKYRVPLVEDAFEEEMKYFGKVPMPIKSMDRYHTVIYLGTFSKILFPGIRIGWIAAEKESIQRLVSIKKFSDLSTGSMVQAALHEFCQLGHYDGHIKRMHRQYRKRMFTALKALKEHLAPYRKVSWNEPAGGYLIWVTMKDTGMDAEQMKKIFLEHGVNIVPGAYFFPDSHARENHTHINFRISISTLNEEEIKEGVKRLAQAIESIYKR